ncbi:MAG TPA: AI-2E family transporter [Candidatus Aquilonibacter sp.]|nr:AI-2E family transporter [Candidatus Aquilonibacter sp.]
MTETSAQKRVGTVLFYAIVAILAYLSYLIFLPFLDAIVWAAVIVVVSYPVNGWLAKRRGRTMAAIITTLGVMVILILPALLIMSAFVQQGLEAGRSIQAGIADGKFNWVNHIWSDLQARFPNAVPTDLATALDKYAEQVAGFLAGKLGTILKNSASFVFHLCVTLLVMFYLYRDGDKVLARLREVLPFEDAHRERMIRDARDLIVASVTSSLVAAAIHGVFGGVAFAVTGLSSPIFWGVMIAFCSFIPVVGTALIWVPATVALFLEGHHAGAILLVVICGGVVNVLDNLVRPWLISGRAEMSGLLVFISVLGGIAVFGLLGVVLGPTIVALAASMLDLYAPVHGAGPLTPAESGGKADAALE